MPPHRRHLPISGTTFSNLNNIESFIVKDPKINRNRVAARTFEKPQHKQ